MTSVVTSGGRLRYARQLGRRGPLGLLAVEVIAAAVLLIHYNRPLWFGLDDWAFLVGPRIDTGWPNKYFSPHNEHWSTIPIVIYRAVYHAVGFTSYLPYALPMILAHLGTCVVLFAILRRAKINAWIAVGTVGVVAFLGSGSEDLLWAFQVGFIGSVFFGLLATLTADFRTKIGPADGLVWLWSILALMCSGIGIPMLVMMFIAATFRRGWRQALVLASAPTLSYVIWYVGIGHLGTKRDLFDLSQYLDLPAYFWTGLTNAWETTSGIPGSGALILAALIVPVVASGAREKGSQLALAGIASTAVLYLMIGTVRAHLGTAQADSSRYVYIAIVLSAPALAWLADRIYRRAGNFNAPCAIALTIVLAAVAVNGVQLVRRAAIAKSVKATISREALLGAEHLIATGAPYFPQSAPFSYALTAQTLARPDIQRAFGDTSPSPTGLLDGAAHIQVDLSATIHHLPTPSVMRWPGVNGDLSRIDLASCTTGEIVNPHAFFEMRVTSAGSEVSITVNSSQLVTKLIDGSATSQAVTWQITPNKPVYLASVASERTVRLMLPPSGKVSICASK